jgi:hypothetical protein
MRFSLRGFIGVVAVLVVLAAGTAAAEMPDILGIQLGMPVREAYTKLQADLPKNKLQVGTTNFPTIEKPVIASFSSNPQQGIMQGDEGDSVNVYVTLPPNKQAAWYVDRTRFFPDKGIAESHPAHLIAREVWKETVAWIVTGTPTTDDSKVTALVWLFDEQGRPGALPSSMRIDNCSVNSNLAESSLPAVAVRNWCHTSFIAVMAQFSTSMTPELYDRMTVTMVNLPLGVRAGDATVNWKKEIAEGAHKRDIEKGKQQEKPKL